VVIGVGAARFWRDTYGPLRGLLRARGWGRTAKVVLTLRHQSGGGADCDYPGDEPGRVRRVWHHLLAYGFGLCAVSTASAAVQQQFLGRLPPYPYLSVPVLTGSAGGLAMLAGGTGLLVLKSRSDPARGSTGMRRADYGFLWALLALAGTGMLALVLRGGALFGPVYLAHLDAVVVAFAICPYTKFPHWVYRTLAIRKYHLDAAERGSY
jgi:citrate/tricarballylate utilization protein